MVDWCTPGEKGQVRPRGKDLSTRERKDKVIDRNLLDWQLRCEYRETDITKRYRITCRTIQNLRFHEDNWIGVTD